MLILFISIFFLRFISRWYISVWDEMNSLLCTYQQHMYFCYNFDFLSKSRLMFLFIIVLHHVIYDFFFPTESCLFVRHYHLSISVIFIHSRVVLPIRKCVQLSSIIIPFLYTVKYLIERMLMMCFLTPVYWWWTGL